MLSPDLASLSAAAVYAVVWGFVFVESGLLVGFLLPGDTVLFGAGLLTALDSHPVSLPLLATGTFVAAVLGDLLGYWTGRRWGRPLLERRKLKPEDLRRAEAWTARWGALMVVAARWVPWLRTLVPVVAGVTRMRVAAFVLADLVGALVWAVGLPVLGHLAASRPWLRDVALTVAGVSVAVFVLAMTLGPARAAWLRARSRRRDDVTEPAHHVRPARFTRRLRRPGSSKD